MGITTYRDLDVWRVSMELVETVYGSSRRWPDSERFGLISQIQRAAVPVPANIAEGYGRIHRKEYLRSLSVARGSLMDVETHLLIAHRLGFLKRDEVKPMWELAQRVGQMLNVQIR